MTQQPTDTTWTDTRNITHEVVRIDHMSYARCSVNLPARQNGPHTNIYPVTCFRCLYVYTQIGPFGEGERLVV